VFSWDSNRLVDVTDLLGLLVEKSLVVTEPAEAALRYWLLETIRQFAAQRLTETGEDAAATAAAAVLERPEACPDPWVSCGCLRVVAASRRSHLGTVGEFNSQVPRRAS
jgi:hypothetical protein